MPYFRTVKVSVSLLSVLLSLILGGALTAAPATPAHPAPVAEWLEGLGPRSEGSAAEGRVFFALTAWFGPRVTIHESDFSEMGEEYSFSKRLWFRIQGKKPGELVVVAPTDGSNTRGLAWAAAWAQRALDHGTEVSLTFLFVGAERGPGSLAGMGSRGFLQDFSPVDPAAAVYLDAGTDTDEVRLTTESGSFLSPLWMVQGFTNAFQKQGLATRLAGPSPSLFRLDLPDRRNQLAPWFEKGVPAVGIAGGPATEALVTGLEAFVSSLTRGLPAQGDQHYLAFHFGTWKLFIDQQTYVFLFLGFSAILLFGYAFVGRSYRGSLRILATGFWQLPILFAALFLSLLAGTALAEALQAARGDPEFWRTMPWVVMAFKGMAACGLTLVVLLPFRRSPLSFDPSFYAHASLVWLGITALAAAAFELSFSFYFLWALVWAAVLVVARWKALRLVALLISPLWLFWGAYEVFGPHPDLELSRWAIASPLAGNFILTALLFPFLLQINAWHLSGHRHQERNESLQAAVQLTFWGLGTLALGLLVLRIGPSAAPTPAPAVRILDLTARPAPALPAGLWATNVERSAFLNRSVWTIRFTGSLSPEQVDLDLQSRGPLTIFDCSFPTVLDAEGTSAQIVIGREPQLPLVVQLTLPRGTEATLHVRAWNRVTQRIELFDSLDLGP